MAWLPEECPMLSEIYSISTPALRRLVAKEWRHQVPEGRMDSSQWRASWHILITRSCTLEFSCCVLILRSLSLSAPLRIWGNTYPSRVGGAAISSRIFCKGSMMGMMTSEPSALFLAVFFRLKRNLKILHSESSLLSMIEVNRFQMPISSSRSSTKDSMQQASSRSFRNGKNWSRMLRK